MSSRSGMFVPVAVSTVVTTLAELVFMTMFVVCVMISTVLHLVVHQYVAFAVPVVKQVALSQLT